MTNLRQDLGVQVVAEGVETAEELEQPRALGVDLFQGFYLARPQFEGLQTAPKYAFL